MTIITGHQIYSLLLNLMALLYQNKVDPRKAKTASSIQYGNRKDRTHARVLYATHTNSKNVIRQRNRGSEEMVYKSTKGAKKKKSRRPNCSSGLPSPRDHNSLKCG